MLDIGISFWYNNLCCETLAQSVEHTPFKRRVEGSNPSCLTTFFACILINIRIQAFLVCWQINSHIY